MTDKITFPYLAARFDFLGKEFFWAFLILILFFGDLNYG